MLLEWRACVILLVLSPLWTRCYAVPSDEGAEAALGAFGLLVFMDFGCHSSRDGTHCFVTLVLRRMLVHPSFQTMLWRLRKECRWMFPNGNRGRCSCGGKLVGGVSKCRVMQSDKTLYFSLLLHLHATNLPRTTISRSFNQCGCPKITEKDVGINIHCFFNIFNFSGNLFHPPLQLHLTQGVMLKAKLLLIYTSLLNTRVSPG